MCQCFSHFLVFLHHFVLATLATTSIGVNHYLAFLARNFRLFSYEKYDSQACCKILRTMPKLLFYFYKCYMCPRFIFLPVLVCLPNGKQSSLPKTSTHGKISSIDGLSIFLHPSGLTSTQIFPLYIKCKMATFGSC